MGGRTPGMEWKYHMRRIAVIKFGGGLITDKSSYRTPDKVAIAGCAEAVLGILNEGFRVIIVHGAGSFGHLLARRWRLIDGADDVVTVEEEQRRDAIETIRLDMGALAGIVIDSLSSLSIEVKRHPPHRWANGTGPDFKGDLSRFEDDCVHITHGDVVDIDGDKGFGILSGDDLMFRLSTELKSVHSAVFAMGDVPGLLNGPPGVSTSQLIDIWHRGIPYVGKHAEDFDVTGGIHLKAARAADIAEVVERVWFVDGRNPSAIVSASVGGNPLGTRITREPGH